jgi:tetratricopeptide (TPR) repeat protein
MVNNRPLFLLRSGSRILAEGIHHTIVDMEKAALMFLAWMLLLPGLQVGFSQAKPGREQQIEIHSRKAAEYLKENQFDPAIAELNAVLAIDPNNVDAHGNLGAVLFFKGAYPEAIPQLRAALKLRPALWKTQALLGMGERRTGEIDAARRDLEKAFPNLSEKKIRIETGMELIELHSSAGELDQAASVVSALRKLDPLDESILYTAYRIYSDLADESLLSLSVVDPNSARMHQAMAHELAKRGDTEKAIENYRAALQLDPSIPGLHFEFAEMLSTLGTPEGSREAASEYQSALQANPRDGQAESRLGEIALRANDVQKAAEHFSRAVELQPNDPEAAVGLAKVLMSQNQPRKAEALLKHALELDPTNATAHYRLSAIYRETGRTSEAKREIEEYQKYRKMKEKLRAVYRGMRRDPGKDENEDPGSIH